MKDALILAVETSSRRGSVALGRGGTLLGEAALQADRKHAAELFPSIQTLLHDAQATPDNVAVLAFSQGPGSFTGLRVAAALARMWQSSGAARVVGVPSLEVIARNALPVSEAAGNIAVLLDARGGRVFAAEFARHGNELEPVRTAGLHEAGAWLAGLAAGCVVIGDERIAAQLRELGFVDGDTLPQPRPLKREGDEVGLNFLSGAYAVPAAREVLAIGARLAEKGDFCETTEILPAYLRPPECEEVYEQRRAAARARRGE